MVEAIIAIEPLGYPGQEHMLGRFDNGLVVAPFAGDAKPLRAAGVGGNGGGNMDA